MATTAPILDPRHLVTEIPDDLFPGQGTEPVTLNTLIAQGQVSLPVDDVPLEGEPPDEGALTPAEQAELAAAQMPPGTQHVPATESPIASGVLPPDPELIATQQRLAFLEAQLAELRALPRSPEPVSPPAPLATPSEDILNRVTQRFSQTFDAIENLDATADGYQQQRARAFAQTIVQAVAEDLMGTEGVRQMVRTEAGQVAQERVQTAMRAAEDARANADASQTIVSLAVQAARAAGYDVHPPGSPEHATSRESVTFWALGNAVSQPGRSADADIQATLALMPPKALAPSPPPAPAPRPQPMGRQGGGQGPGAAQPAATEEYQPISLNQIIEAGLRRQVA